MASSTAELSPKPKIPAARVHALTVATRNENDFALLAVELINPFRAKL
jgi:hypothetical protein